MTEERKGQEDAVHDSAGSVFADLDLPSSEEDLMKINIARAITHTLRKRGLTQVQAAKLLRTDQAKISNVLRGRLKGFSADRLIRYLVFLGKDVEVRISHTSSDTPGRIKVIAA